MSAQSESEVALVIPGEDVLPLDALRGLDSAVIRGFLALDRQGRERVINAYSAAHGDAAGAWLRRAAILWSQQRLGVSRVVLARLFALLPEQMDQPQRLDLAQSIWHVAHAPTKAVLRVPMEFRNHAVLSDLVHQHFMSVLPSALERPQALQLSVPWLQDPAMQAQHSVLNLLLLAERDQLLQLADEQIEVLFARRLDGLEIRSTLSIAGHQLLLRTDAGAQEPSLSLTEQGIAAVRPVVDDRAPRSALLGAGIGGGVALLGWFLYAWLSR